MQHTAGTTQSWTTAWILAIAMIAVWLNLQPDWAFMRESKWAWPVIEYIHVLCLVGFFGLRTAIDLRLTNRAFVGVPIRNLLQNLMPAATVLAMVTIASGMALYSATPEIMSGRPMFQLKIAVLIVALLNFCYLQAYAQPAVEKLEAEGVLPIATRISAALSIALWVVVIVASMLIPYIT